MIRTPITRRDFHRVAGAAGVAAGLAAVPALGQAKPRLVVIGGGPGGATAARYVAKDSKGAIDVTLIEPSREFTTCFFSNLYVGGFRSFESITHSYRTLESEYGIKVVHSLAVDIDRTNKAVILADGSQAHYDALVVAPGIDLRYDTVEGYGPEVANQIPHAWKAGPQTQILKQQLEAMEDGGTFLICPPPNPFRCPPGPYERVSMVAWYFKNHKPNAKILIVDAKDKFSKQGLFTEGWAAHYDGMIEWLPAELNGGGAKAVDVAAKKILTEDDEFEGDVINLIPAQRAGVITAKAGLTDDSDWCPIEPATMRSTRDEAIYVLGDASIAGDMPKSGFSANSQAKVCANAVRAALTDSKQFPARFRNTCWSLIAEGDGVKVGANYEATEEKIAATEKFISKTGEAAQLRAETAEEANGWYAGITKDIFG